MIDLPQVSLSLAGQGRGGDKIRTLRKSTNTAESGPLLLILEKVGKLPNQVSHM